MSEAFVTLKLTEARRKESREAIEATFSPAIAALLQYSAAGDLEITITSKPFKDGRHD